MRPSSSNNMSELKENILNMIEEKRNINSFKSELRSQVLKAMNEFSAQKKFFEKPGVFCLI